MISFIIPTRNEEKVIEKTIQGLQEYKGAAEIIVSDGKSTDKTCDIARSLGAKVVLAPEKGKQNIAIGRNAGAKAATGDFFVFLDADMHIPDINSFFAKALGIFETRERVTALTASIYVYPDQATRSDKFMFSFINHMHYFLNNALGMGASPGEFQMIKAEAFRKAGGYDETLIASEDQELFRRLAKADATYFASDLSVYHSGRRAHIIGWSRLIWTWIMNGLFVLVLKRSFSKEWKEVR